MLSLDALRDRLDRDGAQPAPGQPGGTESRLEGALDAIGWRAAGGSSSAEVAMLAAHVVRNCVRGHKNVRLAVTQLADLLHNQSATLDGSMVSASMFEPAAEEVLRRYAGTPP